MTSSTRLRFLALGLCSGALLLLSTQRLQAQQTCDATRFLAVNSWSAFVTIDGNGSGSFVLGNIEYTYSVHQSIQIGPATLTPSANDPELYIGPENVTFTMNDQYTDTNLDLNTTSSSIVTANGFTAFDAFTGDGANLKISPLPLFCGYAFNAGNFFSPATLANNPGSTSTGLTQWGPGNIPNMLDPFFPQPQSPVAFPTSGVILTGTTDFDSPPLEGTVNTPPGGPFIVHWTIKWTFVPNPESLDLAVTIPNYLSWRPSGGNNENDTGITPLTPNGNLLGMSAQLVDKNTQKPTDFGPDQIIFALVQVSHEPGVAMNWPAKANLINPPPPDMSFKNLDPNLPNLVINPKFMLNSDGTQADFFPPAPSESNPAADILLVPYDWGGWSTLNVTAMVGGIAIKGHLVVPGLPVDLNETNILLPNRQPDSFIADPWKAAHGATGLADNDDSESKPNGDNGPGDGLTIYEEYRGFYLGLGCGAARVEPQQEGTPGAKCVHVEGDPKTKDFFLVNRIGANGIDGIGLFQFASDLNVHYRGLTLGQIGAAESQNASAYRVINFNHSVGPHNVDQHAVILDWGSAASAGIASQTVPTSNVPSGVCGYLPKHTDHIEIDQSLLQESNQLETGSSYSEITIHVAHELSHSVSVCHHGDGVDHFEKWFFDPDTGEVMAQPLAGLSNLTLAAPSAITVLMEDQLLNPVAIGITAQTLGLADDQDKPLSPIRVRVGNVICNKVNVFLNGESSGDVFDFMRYDNTRAFIPAGRPDVRVAANDKISGGTGVDLTDHPLGTGENDPNRSSKVPPGLPPRFGNAANLRGNDRSQVDVNDTHTEQQRPDFVCP